MRSRTLSIAFLSAVTVVAHAQAPSSFIDLGSIVDTQSNYATPDLVRTVTLANPNSIQWFRFTYDGTAGTSFFLDIDTTTVGMAGSSPNLPDTEIGLYSNSGTLLASDDDDGAGRLSALTFGQTAPSRSYTLGSLTPMNAADGRDGALAAGTYWLAVGQFSVIFGSSNWLVVSSAVAPADPFDLNFRTSTPVPEPMTMTVLALGAVAALRRRNRKN